MLTSRMCTSGILQDRFLIFLEAASTHAMRWFAILHRFFQSVSERSFTIVGKLVPLLRCIPCFKARQFFFKIAYTLQQRRLRRVCGEDFFQKFYNRPIANGRVVDILQSLRRIKQGIEEAEASDEFRNHGNRLS